MIDDDEMIRHSNIYVRTLRLRVTQLEDFIFIALFTNIKYQLEIANYTLNTIIVKLNHWL
jgi:hypothetical protein